MNFQFFFMCFLTHIATEFSQKPFSFTRFSSHQIMYNYPLLNYEHTSPMFLIIKLPLAIFIQKESVKLSWDENVRFDPSQTKECIFIISFFLQHLYIQHEFVPWENPFLPVWLSADTIHSCSPYPHIIWLSTVTILFCQTLSNASAESESSFAKLCQKLSSNSISCSNLLTLDKLKKCFWPCLYTLSHLPLNKHFFSFFKDNDILWWWWRWWNRWNDDSQHRGRWYWWLVNRIINFTFLQSS